MEEQKGNSFIGLFHLKSIVLDYEIHQIKYRIQTTIIPFSIRKLAIKREQSAM